MTVLNDLGRFHLVMDTIDRAPRTGDKGIYVKQQLMDKLIEHKQYIDKCARICQISETGNATPDALKEHPVLNFP